jgi:Mg2+-importing ATPase
MQDWLRAARLLAAQFQSPITLILVGAAILSLFLRDITDAVIILVIVCAGALLSFWQEYSAANAVAALLALVNTKVTVLRDQRERELPSEELVPGDVVLLSAGSAIPGDCRLLEAKDLFVNESALTGEAYPAEKHPGQVPVGAPLPERSNVLFQGTHVVSGNARAVVVLIGQSTELGRISRRLHLRPPETEFEHGVRRLGHFLLELTLLLILAILAVHLALKHPPLESFLFSLALAVGLTPQLLPAVIAVNLAHGARRLAACQVIVRRLSSIENLGSMNVLCADKTGTLTVGRAEIEGAIDFLGSDSPRALRLAWLNAVFETGFANPIDEALRRDISLDRAQAEKLDEIPYDFVRKRLSVLVREDGEHWLIAKGAVANVLDVCDAAESSSGVTVGIREAHQQIDQRIRDLGEQGRRILAIACRRIDTDCVNRTDEAAMTLVGLLVIRDPPKPGLSQTLTELRELGIELKMISGDNCVVAASVAKQVGLETANVLTGAELRQLGEDALLHRVSKTAVFAEIDPHQKERIVLALRKAGQVVGYLGDGINDATALHAADVGISVDQSVDVAREAADIVLLRKDLEVLVDGIREGRATFANTLKYVLLATSANFGNMFSMAGASLFLPFLPLLPKQVLLTNLLTDLPEMTIARDRVDEQLMQHPQRWNIHQIQRFMLVFGLISSAFDYAAFGVLLLIVRAGEAEFRTGWFVESVVSACAIVLVIRSREPLWRSRPAWILVVTTIAVIAVVLVLPFTPLAGPLGFVPLSPFVPVAMLTIVVIYGISAELAKRWFYRDKPAAPKDFSG